MGTAQRLLISGRVQGVGYRAWAVRQATLLGLAGFVRNLGDGRVEAVVQGPEEPVRRFIEACRHGPRLARVDGLEAAPTMAAGPLHGFRELPSA